MTATEELCALLDARGAEWDRGLGSIVEWVGANERLCRAYARPEPLTVDVAMISVTPAQAVEATLGRGTCKMDHEDGNDTWWSCNACDADVYLPTKPKFCWNCGREVVE